MTLIYTPGIPGAPAGPYVASVLRTLGYDVRLRKIPDAGEYFDAVNSRDAHAAINGWFADYPSPSAFIGLPLSCSNREATDTGFCSRSIDREMRRALELQELDARAAGAMWARIDRRITDEAPWVPMVNLRVVELVSERVGNYQSNPQWGVLLDQLWVR